MKQQIKSIRNLDKLGLTNHDILIKIDNSLAQLLQVFKEFYPLLVNYKLQSTVKQSISFNFI